MEMGKQPVIFENPMYSSQGGAMKMAEPAKVRSYLSLTFKGC